MPAAHVLQQIRLGQSNEYLGIRKGLLVWKQEAGLEDVAEGVAPLTHTLLFGACKVDIDHQTGDVYIGETFEEGFRGRSPVDAGGASDAPEHVFHPVGDGGLEGLGVSTAGRDFAVVELHRRPEQRQHNQGHRRDKKHIRWSGPST